MMRAFSALALAVSLCLCGPAFADAPAAVKTQVPGYYRLMLGNTEVTALYDGNINLQPSVLQGNAEAIDARLKQEFELSAQGIPTSVNAFLVNTGKHLILLDTGTATCFGPGLGQVEKHLRASGYTPEQVDSVVLTHLHPDHACGLLNADDDELFTQAKVYVSRQEADFWLNDEVMAKQPKELQNFAAMSKKAVKPYQDDDRFETFEPGDTLLDTFKAEATPGHTPGHTSFKLTADGQNFWLWGDIIHNQAVQFANPKVSIEFDVDNQQAIKTREALLQQLTTEGSWVAGAHLPFPGLGHIGKTDAAYRWIPAEYHPTTP